MKAKRAAWVIVLALVLQSWTCSASFNSDNDDEDQSDPPERTGLILLPPLVTPWGFPVRGPLVLSISGRPRRAEGSTRP